MSKSRNFGLKDDTKDDTNKPHICAPQIADKPTFSARGWFVSNRIVVFVLCHSNKHRGVFSIVMRLQFVDCYRVCVFFLCNFRSRLILQILYTFVGIFDIVFGYIVSREVGGVRFGRFCGAMHRVSRRFSICFVACVSRSNNSATSFRVRNSFNNIERSIYSF